MWVYVHNVTNFIKKEQEYKNKCSNTVATATDSANEGGTNEHFLQAQI